MKWYLTGWLLATMAGCLVVYHWTLIDLAPMPAEAASRWALRALESVRDGRAVPAPPPEAGRTRAGPVFVTAWWRGRPRAQYRGDDLLSAVNGAVAGFKDDPELTRLPGWSQSADSPVRFTVTVTRGFGPLVGFIPLVSTLSIAPMLDGVRAELRGRSACLLPHELWAEGMYERGVKTPIPDLSFGVNLPILYKKLAEKLDVSSDELLDGGTVRRFRASTLMNEPYPSPFHAARKTVTPEALETAARQGAAFLLRHQLPGGRYAYIYDGRTGEARRSSYYSMPRHAGTTYFLAQADRLLDMPEAGRGAYRALQWERRNALRRCGSPDTLCIESYGRVNVGSAALTALAAAEILQKHDHAPVRRLLEGLITFLRSMQRPDGELMHEYDLKTDRPRDIQRMYFSGEAAFALLNAYRVTGDERNLDTVRKLMKHLTGSGWSFFGSRYYYGEEHWTCQAAGEASKHMDVTTAFDFCLRWGAFNRKIQYRDTSPWSIDGAYGVGPVLLPRLTPVASRTEALIPIYLLARKRGLDAAPLRDQIERGLGFLLRYRWAPGPAHLLFDPRAALGGVPGSPTDLASRNDYVQHAGTAMLLWAQVLREEGKR
jgi:hypothetical protein